MRLNFDRLAGDQGVAFDAGLGLQIGREFLGILGDGRPSVVVDGKHAFGFEKLCGLDGVGGAHRKPVADGEAGEVDVVKFAEELHVGEEGGVAGEVDGGGFAGGITGERIREFEDPTAGVAAVSAIGEGRSMERDSVCGTAEGEIDATAVIHGFWSLWIRSRW